MAVLLLQRGNPGEEGKKEEAEEAQSGRAN